MANAEGVRTTLQIATLVPARLGVYRVSARNAVGASEESVRVLRRDHRSSDARRDSSAPVSGDRRPGYSHSHGNAPPGKRHESTRFHKTALPVNGSTHLIPAYYTFIDPERTKG